MASLFGDLKTKLWKSQYPDQTSSGEEGSDDRSYTIFTAQNEQRLKNVQAFKLQLDFIPAQDYYGMLQNKLQDDLKNLKISKDSSCTDNGDNINGFDDVDHPAHSSSSCPFVEETRLDSRLITLDKLNEHLLVMENSNDPSSKMKTKEAIDAQEYILDVFKDFDLLEDLLTLDRSRVFICRLLVVIEDTHAGKLFCYILKKLTSWSDQDPDDMLIIYNLLKSYIMKCEASDMIDILPSIDMTKNLSSTRVGISVLMALLHRGDQLYCDCKVTCSDFRKNWTNWSSDVIELIYCILDDMEMPFEVFQDYCLNVLEMDEHYIDGETKTYFRAVMVHFINSNKATII